AVIAARAAKALGIPWHPPEAAATATHKLRTRERMRAAGLPVPAFIPFALHHVPSAITHQPLTGPFPCVVQAVALSGSRGVMRADDARGLDAAIERLRALMQSPDVRAERNDAHATALVEAFIPGREYAIEALMQHGTLHVLAMFDKPDPLDGPFFEETIYVTPSRAPADEQRAIEDAVARATAAIGLHHGPVHAEGRANADGVFILDVAPRPIRGLCARALRFAPQSPVPGHQSPVTNHPNPESQIPNPHSPVPFEELLLRHALGEDVADWQREDEASGVMMIPILRRGIYRGVDGVDAAHRVAHVDEVRVTAKPDQLLIPLPEGASYLGFIFARASAAADVERALRDAHARLAFHIAPEFPVLAAAAINYNQQHG